MIGQGAAKGQDPSRGLAKLIDSGIEANHPPRLVGLRHRHLAAAEGSNDRQHRHWLEHRLVYASESRHRAYVPFCAASYFDWYRQSPPEW